MPTVPTLDVPTVSPVAPPTPNASAEAFGAGVARSMQGLGQQLQRSSDTMFEIAQERHKRRQDPLDKAFESAVELDDAESFRQDLIENRNEASLGGDWLTKRRARWQEIHNNNVKRRLEQGYRPSPNAINNVDLRRIALEEQFMGHAVKMGDDGDQLRTVTGAQENAARIQALALESGDIATASAHIDRQLETLRTSLPPEAFESLKTELEREMGNTTLAHLARLQEENIRGDATDEEVEALVVQGQSAVDAAIAKNYLDPAKGDEIKLKFEQGVRTRTLQAMEPTKRFAQVSGGSLVDKIIQIESSGDPNARASTSRAVGLAQAIPSTWRMFLEARHPNLVGSPVDHRLDPALAREMVEWYAEENSNYLSNRGLPVNEGTIYLAHFLGPEGAAEMLRAGEDENAVSVNPRAANSNRAVFYNKDGTPKSAGQVRQWAARKMGSQVGGIAKGLPADELANIASQAATDMRQEDAQTAAEVSRRQSEQADLYKYQVELAQVGQGPMPLISTINDDVRNGLLDAGGGAEILQRMGAASEQTTALARALTRVNSGGPINAFDPDDRKAANLAFEFESKAENLPAGYAMDFIRGHNFVPDKAVSDIRQGLASPDVATRAAALIQARDVHGVAGPALAQTANGGEVRDAALAFNTLVSGRGYTAEQAAQHLMQMESSDWKADKARLETDPIGKAKAPMDVFLEKRKISEVTSQFDSIMPGDAPVFSTTGEELAAESDYREFAAEGLIKFRGNEDMALDWAKARTLELWNVSNATGTPNFMKFPPERHYPLSSEQLNGEVQRMLADVGEEVSGIELRPLAMPDGSGTADDIRRGRPPGYSLSYWRQTPAGPVWEQANEVFAIEADQIQRMVQEAHDRRVNELVMARPAPQKVNTRSRSGQEMGGLPSADSGFEMPVSSEALEGGTWEGPNPLGTPSRRQGER